MYIYTAHIYIHCICIQILYMFIYKYTLHLYIYITNSSAVYMPQRAPLLEKKLSTSRALLQNIPQIPSLSVHSITRHTASANEAAKSPLWHTNSLAKDRATCQATTKSTPKQPCILGKLTYIPSKEPSANRALVQENP